MSKKNDSFKKFRDDHLNNRINLIRTSIKILSGKNYEFISHYATAVAKLLTEFDALQARNDQAADKELPAVSASNLLRSTVYRPILEAGFSSESKAKVESITNEEALKIKIACLEGEIALLKNKIVRMDQGDHVPDASNEELTNSLQAKQSDIAHLLKLIDKVIDQFRDALKFVLEGEESHNRPVAGLYGPYGLIETLEYMNRVERIRREKN
jgi:hypothetical protein